MAVYQQRRIDLLEARVRQLETDLHRGLDENRNQFTGQLEAISRRTRRDIDRALGTREGQRARRSRDAAQNRDRFPVDEDDAPVAGPSTGRRVEIVEVRGEGTEVAPLVLINSDEEEEEEGTLAEEEEEPVAEGLTEDLIAAEVFPAPPYAGTPPVYVLPPGYVPHVAEIDGEEPESD